MALGAERGSVLRLVVGGGVRLAVLGIAVGIAVALALTQLMRDLLYGVRATDPLTFGAVVIVLAATGFRLLHSSAAGDERRSDCRFAIQ